MAKKATQRTTKKASKGVKAVKHTKRTVRKSKASKQTNPIKNPMIDNVEMFSAVLPPLADDVYEALKESIREDGVRERLTVWKSKGKRILVDGHNRLKICKELKRPYKIREKSFENEEDVKEWMWENQESRRNMTPYQRIEVVLQFKGIVREKARRKQSEAGGAVCKKVNKAACEAKAEKIRTNAVLGKIAGVSFPQVDKVFKIQEKIAEGVISQEVLAALRNGDESIDGVYKEYCKNRRTKQQSEQDVEERSNSFMKFLKMHVAKAFPKIEDCTILYDKIIEWANARKAGVEEPSE